jgi:hypothetical protein
MDKKQLITHQCPTCIQYWKTDPKGFTTKWQAIFKDLIIMPICVEGCKGPTCNNQYKHHRWYCFGMH